MSDSLEGNGRILRGTVFLAEEARKRDPDNFVIEEVVFDGVTVVGPAVVIVLGKTQLRGNSFPPNIDGWLWTFPKSKKQLLGCIGARDCLFEGCTFRGVAIMGDEGFV